jgi:hypothetical protein
MVTGQITPAAAVVLLFDNSAGHYKKLIVKAATANTSDMAIGNEGVTVLSGFLLDFADTSQPVEIDISTVKKLYAFAATSQTLSFIAV